MVKTVSLFTKRAPWGHDRHPARREIPVRSSIEKGISILCWK